MASEKPRLCFRHFFGNNDEISLIILFELRLLLYGRYLHIAQLEIFKLNYGMLQLEDDVQRVRCSRLAIFALSFINHQNS